MTSLAIVAALGAVASRASWRGFTLREWWRETHSGVVVWQVDTRSRMVALTFDDGPDPRYTPRILAILKRYGAHATFFEEGRCIEAHPELTRQVLADGNDLGNHTYSHPYLEKESARAVRDEISRCDRSLLTAAHYRTHLFRAPRARWNPTIYRECRRRHDRIIDWSVALEHHDAPTPDAMARRVLRIIRPGGIVLMHDGAFVSRETTVTALPLVLDGLKHRGYRCVTVTELLRAAVQ